MIKDFSIEKLFVLIALLFGLLYVLILPPFQSVDEGMHFFRTYQISQGKIVSQNRDGVVGDILPQSLSNFYELYVPFIKNIDKKQTLENIKRDLKLDVNPENTVFTEFRNTSLYSPVCYISQLPGVIIAKFFNPSLGFIYYLGRLSNLLIYCLLAYWAIRLTPFYKCPMLLLALMPMSLSLAGAYTCDVAVFGLNFLWVSMILKALTNDRITKNFIALLIFLAFLIALTKSYILILPLIFLLPINKFKNKPEYLSCIAGVFLAVSAGLFITYLCNKELTLNMKDTVANADLQFEFIKSHPLSYIWVLVKTFLIKTPRIYITMIGVLGWQDTKLDFITYLIYPVLMYFAVMADNFKFTLAKWQKYIIGFVLIIGTIITYTSLYLMWSPVGNNVVLGLNGKYFIPMMLPLLLLFKKDAAKFDYEKVKFAIVIALILILVSSELSLLHRFYNITPQLYYKI